MPLQGYGHRFGPNFSRIDTRLEDALPRLDEAVVTLEDEENDVALTERVVALEEAVAALLISQASQDTAIATAQSDIGELADTDTAQGVRLDTAESDIEALEDATGSVVADIVDAATLQTRLDNDAENGYRNRLKTGAIACTATIDIDGGYGGLLEGHGGTLATNSVQSRQWSALYRSGSLGSGNPLVRYKRAHATISRLGLYGDSAANITNNSYTDGELGFLMIRDDSAFDVGTGKLTSISWVLDAWDTAIQIGSGPDEANCDESLWIYPVFWRCDKAVRNIHKNALGHCWIHPHFQQVDVCYEILGGGDINIQHPFYGVSRSGNSGAAFLRFKNTTPDQFGDNSGATVVTQLKLDLAAIGVRLLDMDAVAGAGYDAHIDFLKPQVPYDAGGWGGPMFFLSGNTHLTINGATLLYPGAIRWSLGAGVQASITIENCKQCLVSNWHELFDKAGSTSTSKPLINFTNNYSNSAGRLPDQVAVDSDAIP